jgi:hypothetical protein
MSATQFGGVSVRKLSLGGSVLMMLLVLLAFVTQRPEAIMAGSLLCAVYAVSGHQSLYVDPSSVLCFGGISLFFMPSLLSMNHGLSPFFYYFSTIAIFFAARKLSRHSPEDLLVGFRVVFAIVITAIFVVLFVYWDYPEPFGELIDGSSTNGIPSYLIVLQIVLSLSTYVARRRLPIISPMLTFVVAYFGVGRGSLIVAGLIFGMSIFFNIVLMNSANRSRRSMYVIFFLTIFSIKLLWDWGGRN